MATSLAATVKLLEETNLALSQQDLRRTLDFAGKIYGDAKHWTGLSMLEHAVAVLQILLPFHPDADTVRACILMHALEKKGISIAELETEFGTRVRQFVSGINLLSHVNAAARRGSIEELRLMLLSVADDIRIVLVVLCKRCFALERSEMLATLPRKRLAKDVLSLFAPVAARLGIHTLKQRLEALAFPILYPSDAEHINGQVGELHQRYGRFLDDAAYELKTILAEAGIKASVQGREKHLYSIFVKMRSKSISHIESLPDLFALRVVVQSGEECYHALGVLHRIGRPAANRFKDYIAFPKPNGYQSLHTTVARLPSVPEGVFVEVQVRTAKMHREAEYGVAAHWSYKEGGSAAQSVARVSLQQALASQHAVETLPGGLAGHLVDHIFVLTPKGDVVELPESATPLDFAFQIHTQLGLSFRGARVNGASVPLDYELENGDVVEILTQKIPKPSPGWLQLLKMASSRSRLKRYLHTRRRDEFIMLGKEMISAELQERGLPALDADLSVLRLHRGKALSPGDREDLLFKIGQGSDRVGSLLQRLDLLPRSQRAPSSKRPRVRLQRKDALIEIEGDMPMPTKFAKCCKANDGDHEDLAGIITRGGDVMVHRKTCANARRGNPERRVGVRWRV